MTTELDNQTPGGVYLCQVDENISCGACCGLYNVEDASEAALTAMLIRRTKDFENTPRTLEGILAFKNAVKTQEPQNRPFPEFHHCPYIGMIGEKHSRVGCLLHPLADGNKGVDFRGLSFYGGMACRTYFCPSCHHLPENYKKIVRKTVNSWYLHGLIITERRLIKGLFEAVENHLGRSLNTSYTKKSLEKVLALKLNWQFQPHPKQPANYFFEDGLYPRPRKSWGSRYDAIFQELESCFKSPEEIFQAETILESFIAQVL